MLESWGIYSIESISKEGTQENIEFCGNCHNKINLGSYIITDYNYFVESVGKLLGTELSESEIGECQYCNNDIIVFTQRHGSVRFKISI